MLQSKGYQRNTITPIEDGFMLQWEVDKYDTETKETITERGESPVYCGKCLPVKNLAKSQCISCQTYFCAACLLHISNQYYCNFCYENYYPSS